MKMWKLLFVLILVALCTGQKRKREQLEWDYRTDGFCAAQQTNTKRCSNLTLVLDNWKFAIVNQVKDLLLHEPDTVLPEYGRIQPLSEALAGIYTELKALKENLGKLTNKFEQVEAFVDDIQAGSIPMPNRVDHPMAARSRGSPIAKRHPELWQVYRSRALAQKTKRSKSPQG